MALPLITPAEIRFRLRSLTVLDLSDNTLNSASFIPHTDAWANINIGASAVLTTDEEACIKAAKIAHTSLTVVSSAPVQLTKTSVIDPKYIPAELKKVTIKELKREVKDAMSTAGYKKFSFYVGEATGPDYGNSTSMSWVRNE